MPEYLAPGVYIEEVPSGNKPIEGVSTSTAGMVGVTQRGPVNMPTLTTSYADFVRKFGGYLDHRVFTDNRDALPYAAEGFFTNGGQRLYVTRVVGTNAAYAQADLYGTPRVDPASTTLTQLVTAGADTLLLDSGNNIAQNDILLIKDGTRSEYVTAQSDPVAAGVRLLGRLQAAHNNGDNVTPQTPTDDQAFDPNGDFAAAAMMVALVDVLDLAATEVLRIADDDDEMITEYVTVAAVDAGTNTATLSLPLQFAHAAATTTVTRVTLAAGAPKTLTDDVAVGAFMLPLNDTVGLAADALLQLGGEFQVVRNVVSSLSIVTSETTSAHTAGVEVIKQVALLRAYAHYQGQWGNRLRISIRHSSVLDTTVTANVAQNANPIKLAATFGLGAGSVLDIKRGAADIARQRVTSVSTATNEVDVEGGADADLLANDTAASLEFDIIVERLDDQGKVVESEAFLNLGLDPTHNRYAPKIMGVFDAGTGEPEETGQSELLRLEDLIPDAQPALRLLLPYDGVNRTLSGGDDDLATIDKAIYIGADAADPDDRTGIFAMKSIDDISIVAVPGQTDQDVQNKLIEHCTEMRYRFAVLDSAPNAKMKQVQTQRQLYDTTYGALYYPWVVIGDPFGRNGDVLNLPPSGYVAGIYARSDVQRGVHKAPANEVVMGVRDLQVRLTKGEQDILNPKHINCLRDFRDMNRGLRVWGARTLSSDAEWKYVNVRRLFLFVEKSIERGTQFAVFEPNAEPLWGTIKRSLTNFLTTVWRSGALEGTKAEEAFFVKVDRTTMTQDDIDNGRLIILVGIAPVKPAEFVIFRISQKTREATG